MTQGELASLLSAWPGSRDWFLWSEFLPGPVNASARGALIANGTIERRTINRHDPRRASMVRGAIQFEYRYTGKGAR